MSSTKPTIAAAILFVAAVAVLAWWIVGDTPRAALLEIRPDANTSDSTAEGSGRDAPLREPAQLSENRVKRDPSATKVSVRGFLASYWGLRWPEVEMHLRGRGFDLDAEIDPASIPMWEEVEQGIKETVLTGLAGGDPERLRNFIRLRVRPSFEECYGEEMKSINTDGKELSAEDERLILDVARPYDETLEGLADELFLAETRVREQAWTGGLYTAGPFAVPASVAEPKPHGDSIVHVNGVHNSWAVRCYIDLGRDPDCQRILAEIKRLQEARRHAVREYLRSL